MPRTGGIYSLPPGYFATPGATILVTQHNPPLEDIAQALTDSYPRDGSVPLVIPAGTVAAPGLSVASDPNTGLYSPGGDQLAFSLGGVQRMLLNTTSARFLDGTASAPSITFISDTNTGIYRSGADSISISAGSAAKITVTATGIAVNDSTTFAADLHLNLSGTGHLKFSGASYNAGTTSIEGLQSGDGIAFPSAGNMIFASTANEIARITADGYRIGQSSTSTPGNGNNTVGLSLNTDGQLNISAAGAAAGSFNRSGSDGSVFIFRRQSTQVGSINVTGSATAYNTSSDYRLKFEVPPQPYDACEMIKALAGAQRWYGWNDVPDQIDLGWYAHELAEIEPRAVTGEKDGEEMQGRDDSKLVVHLVAALADALKRIEALEAKHGKD